MQGLIQINTVCKRADLTRQQVNFLCLKKRFPLPVKDGRGNITWWESEVEEWIDNARVVGESRRKR